MARKKLEINATDDQLGKLYETLKAGGDLRIALQRAAISMATYMYWVAISSIVSYVKSQEEIEEIEAIAKSGVSIQNVRDLAAAAQKGRKTGVGIYIEPSQESVLQYRNVRRFREFADKCYTIVTTCDQCRSDFATLQLTKIARSTDKKNGINPSGAMWWLERNFPDLYAKPSDRAKEDESEQIATVPSIEVEFIDPESESSSKRLADMEEQILKDMKGLGEA